MMGVSLKSLQDLKTPVDWIQQLQKLRQPNVSRRDQLSEKQAKQLPWPKGAQVEWKRWGDRSGIELRLRLDNLEQLEDRARALLHTFEIYKKAHQPKGTKSL
jgi:hypothetical protein